MAKLTSAQIRKIIKAHNIEATVKIPAGLKQAELEKFVESQGFKINHNEKSISKGGKTITLEDAEKVTAPKQKTALQKQKAEEKKQEKVVEQKKKEREIKKEAVKKATKDLVPKTKIPEKVGSKPVPKKAEVKKEEPKKPPRTIKKDGEKFVQFTEKEKELQKKILEKKKKKEAEARKPKRKVLGETKKPSGSAVVQPGKPEDVKVKKTVVTKKKPKPAPKAEPKKEEPKKEEPKKEKPAWLIQAEKEKAEAEQKQKAELLNQYKDKWEKNFKKNYKWTDAQVKRIEEILFNKNGIKSSGAENVEDGFKLFFSVDGKSESSATFKFPKFSTGKKDQSMMIGYKEKN